MKACELTDVFTAVAVVLPYTLSTDARREKILPGPVVRKRVSASPGLNFNLGFFFVLTKALSRIIFFIFLACPIIKF